MYPYSTNVLHYTIQPYDSILLLAQRFQTSIEDIIAMNPGLDPYNLLIGQNIHLPLKSQNTASSFTRAQDSISKAQLELKSNMRLLWEQHIAWTRMTIISLTFHLPDVNFVVTRLLRNAIDMGHSLRPFYGNEIANHYGNLIKEHLVIAADLVKAAIAGNQKSAADLEKKWYANGDEITEFWSQLNPFIGKEVFRKMFYEHLALTKTEAVSMITKDFKADVEVFDKIETEALEMADAISDAIIKQFPGMFHD